jgi:hypothetical protein
MRRSDHPFRMRGGLVYGGEYLLRMPVWAEVGYGARTALTQMSFSGRPEAIKMGPRRLADVGLAWCRRRAHREV